MAIMREVLKEEHDRLQKIKENYISKINALPRGCIKTKNIRNRLYQYLCFRDGPVVRSVYIKDSQIEELKFQLGQRKRLTEELNEIEKDLKFIEKALKIRV